MRHMGDERCGIELANDLVPVEARHEVTVQEGERRREARGTLLDDRPPRRDEQQQVHERDAHGVEQHSDDGHAHNPFVLGTLADDAVVGLEEGRLARRAWSGLGL
jgi:hypothetical protein